MERLRINKVDFIIFIGFLIVTFSISIFNAAHFQNIKFNIIIDSFGNIGGVIVASFFFNSFSEKVLFKDRIKISLAVGTGLIIYEFLQKWIPWQTFDKNDVYGSIIGVIIAILINGLVRFALQLKELKTKG